MTATLTQREPELKFLTRGFEDPSPVPEFCLTRGWHRLSGYDCGVAIRRLVRERPVVLWGELAPGRVYTKESGEGSAFQVVSVTPTRARANVRVLRQYSTVETTYYRGEHGHGGFIQLDQTLIDLLGVRHASIVHEAHTRSLEVPPGVRCEYPGVFVRIPGWIRGSSYGRDADSSEDREDRVKRVLEPRYDPPDARRTTPTTRSLVLRWIDESHREIARLTCERVRRTVEGHVKHEDYDRYIENHQRNIEFYRWLEPLVAEGGVFWVPEGDRDADT